MSELRTAWPLGSRAGSQQRTSILLASCLLSLMAIAEVLFLRYVAGPDSVNLMAAAEGIPTNE